MATFLVNDTADTDTSGTLRFVLGQLKASNDPTNEIDFKLPGNAPQTIVLGSDLPSISKLVTIDGYNSKGTANTATVGTNASIAVQLDLAGHAGLVFAQGSANSVVKGLSIYRGTGAGISVQDNGVSVVGDFLGIMADGLTTVPNATGVSVALGVTGTVIGTSALADRNLVSGNTGAGIAVAGAATIQGNLIGTDKSGIAAAANGQGVNITGANSVVGGTAAGQANRIAFNTGAGVTVDGVIGVPIRQNLIFQNGQGIVLANGGNGNLVAPGLLAATSVAGLTTIEGQYTAPAAGSYTLEFFASLPGDPATTQGQAHVFLGQTTLIFATSGTQAFRFISPFQVAAGQVITATATSPTLSTSTFATAIALSPAYTVTNTLDTGIGSLRQAITDFQAAPAGTSKIDFNIPGSGIHTITLASVLPSVNGTVAIDGTTEPGFAGTPLIRLDGNGVVTDGLTLAGSPTQSASILALDVVHFSGAGIKVLSGRNTIQGNVIGADPTAGAAGPGNNQGLFVSGSNNTLTGNTIAFNTAALTIDTGAGDTVSRNVIFQNGQAIVLSNNGNNNLPAPTSLATISVPGSTTIEGKFNAPSAGSYILEFFVSASGDPTGTPGQGHVFLGSKTVVFGTGPQVFQFTTAAQIPAGQVVTATITSTSGDTSAFAAPAGLIDPFLVTTTADSGIGSLRQAILDADQNPDANTITFAIPTSDPNYDPAANAWTIKPATALPAIGAPVTIDGTSPTQFNGVPVIQLDGSLVSGSPDGLNLAPGSSGSRVRSLAVYHFAGAGIHVQSGGNAIQGNSLGTDASGQLSGVGNQTGLLIDNAAGNTVGGLSGLGNVISGNTKDGVLLQGDGSTSIVLLGNKIGTELSGATALANGRDGVRVVVTTAGLNVRDTIGGTANGAGNTIAFNSGAAVTVDTAAGVAMTRDAIFQNGQGIVLVNNGNQNLPAPTLTTVNSAGGNTQIAGQLLGAPSSTSYTIEFFASAANDPSSSVQARTFLGSTTVAAGSTAINATLAVGLAAGQRVTSTATSNSNPIETSPFSIPVTVVSPFLVTTTADSGPGSLRQAISNANAAPGVDPITFAIPTTDPGYNTLTKAWTIQPGSVLPIVTSPTVSIDGTTQTGFLGTPVIRISGASLSGKPDGIVLGSTADSGTIRGLAIVKFAGAGLRIQSSGDVIQGNVIGASGLSNAQGVVVSGSNNVIGGSSTSAGNTISFNVGAGVTVAGGTGDAISENLIFQNGSGILLSGGGNAGQPAPVLTLVNSVAGTTSVLGTLSGSTPNTLYTVEFFASTASEPTSGDQARVFLGSTQVTTDGSGFATINGGPFAVNVPVLQRVTATATSASPLNNTSSFASSVAVVSPLIVTNTLNSGAGSLRQAITNANVSLGANGISFVIPTSDLGYDPTGKTWTIRLATSLPGIDGVVVLDGASQPGFAGKPVVRIDGNGLAGDGLVFNAGSAGSTLRGLNIVNFAGAGVVLKSGGDVLQRNFIGTDFTGSAQGTGTLGSGVVIATSNNNVIGGAVSGAPNVIAFVTGAGIIVDGGVGNEIRQNTIFHNGGAGISLINGGNKVIGGNTSQPAPVLTLANSIAGTTTIAGTLPGSTPSTLYTLEFFASTPSDLTSGDQARVFLGSTQVTTDATKTTSFSAVLPVDVAQGLRVTATATSASPGHNTSAFANSVAIASPFLVTTTLDSGAGSLRQAILNANVNPGLDTIKFAIAGDPTIRITSPLPVITDLTTIDGTTEPGFAGTPLVIIDGTGVTGTGLTLGAGSSRSTVVGIKVTGFSDSGIVISSSNNTIGRPELPIGNIVTGNGGSGIVIVSGTNNNLFHNDVFKNGSATTLSALNDIVLNPLANNSAPPPMITGVQLVNSNLLNVGMVFLFPAGTFPAGIPAGLTASVEIFRNSAADRPFLVAAGYPATVPIVADPFDPTRSLPVTIPLNVTGQGFVVGSQVFATATFSGGATSNPLGTSAFSNIGTAASPLIVSNNLDDGIGSLRQAILTANLTAAADTITFCIDTREISPIIQLRTPLPAITHPVLLDATTEPNFKGTPIVEIDGSGIFVLNDGVPTKTLAPADGLLLAPGSDGSTVQGLSLYGFTKAGTVTDPQTQATTTYSGAGIHSESNGDTFAANWLGLSPTNASSKGNLLGIFLDNASLDVIGLPRGGLVVPVYLPGCVPEIDGLGNPVTQPVNGRNLVSNNGVGIKIENGGSNVVENAFVGTSFFDVAKEQPRTNQGDGILVINSANNAIGVDNPGTGALDPTKDLTLNLISGNGGNGIHFTGIGSTGNTVLNSYIGTDPTGNSSSSTIGNKKNGILIDGGASSETIGAPSLFNADGSVTSFHGALISGNLGSGVEIVGGGRNTILGNLIGTSADGQTVLGNGLGGTLGDGILITNSGLNQVGGVRAGDTNVITGSGGDGVHITGNLGNTVQGNLIGAATAVVRLAGNRGSGVRISDGYGNIIGFSNNQKAVASDPLRQGGNTIDGNGKDGVTIEYTTSPSSTTTVNFVGENVIAHNSENGVQVKVFDTSLYTGPLPLNSILHNFIGTDSTGNDVYVAPSGTTSAIAHGNGLDGVRLHGIHAIIAANVVSGNGLSGIDAESSDPAGSNLASTLIDGNMLGTDRTGTKSVSFLVGGQTLPMGNVLDGLLLNNVVEVAVGTVSPNVLSGNLGRGVEIRGDRLTIGGKNTIMHNVIGLDVTGKKAEFTNLSPDARHFNLGNLSDGVFLYTASATDLDSNVISNNRGFGVHAVSQNSKNAPMDISVKSNHIGTNVDGTAVVDAAGELLGNSGDGIFFDGLAGAEIDLNVISGNRANGIDLLNSKKVTVLGNKIGTDETGTIRKDEKGNIINAGFGNAGSGVFLNQSSGNVIGPNGNDHDVHHRNVISGNLASGVFVSGTNGIDASNNVIAGDLIGTDITGTMAIPNAVAGLVLSHANDNTVGSPTTPTTPTVISGNTLFGVLIAGDSTGNTITASLIGTNQAGDAALPNTADGIVLINVGGNTIGGLNPSQGNVISGNRSSGIRIFGGAATGNVNHVANNIIGLSLQGAALTGSRGNQGDGVLVDNATPGNVIGPGNTISGNGQAGVDLFSVTGSGGTIVAGNFIGTDPTGTMPRANSGNGISIFGSSKNDIGSSIPDSDPTKAVYRRGNVISGNSLAGIQIFSPASNARADFNLVHGNKIGTDLDGNCAIANRADGIQILNGNGNLIGGMVKGLADGNVISGNELNGVYLDVFPTRAGDKSFFGDNKIDGNYIGTNAAGTAALPSSNGKFQRNGVIINNGPRTYIGDIGLGVSTVSGTNVPTVPRNVISGNTEAGIQFAGRTSNNVVQGNYIGIGIDILDDGKTCDDPASKKIRNDLANSFGVYVNNAGSFSSVDYIGGSTPGAGNIIGGGSSTTQTPSSRIGIAGIVLSGPQDTRFQGGSVVQGNVIGLDRSGRPSGSGVGIFVLNSSGNQIGGPGARERNVISGNNIAGVELFGTNSTANTVVGNFIGTNFAGDKVPAAFLPERDHLSVLQQAGVLTDSAYSNTIGTASAGNVISGNVDGVVLKGVSTSGKGNTVSGNQIGTSYGGLIAVPNFEDGIQINGSRYNIISSNQISGNGSSGVNIVGELSASNNISGNVIGLDSNRQPTFVLKNVDARPATTTTPGYPVYPGGQLNGITIIGSSNNSIAGNLIGGNLNVGLYITQRDFLNRIYAAPVNTNVQNNQISSNGIYGVLLFDSPRNLLSTVKGTTNSVVSNPTNFLNYVSRINGQSPQKPPRSIFLLPITQTRAASVPSGPSMRKTASAKAVPLVRSPVGVL